MVEEDLDVGNLRFGPSAGCVALALAAAACCLARPDTAWARRSGIVGFSGKQGATCNEFLCHAGGVQPQARFEGPERVEPGQTTEFRFLVVSRSPLQTAAGFNVAAGGGELNLLVGQSDATMNNDELTHTRPKDNDAEGIASWDFRWTAPLEPGDYVLFGAGNSIDGSFDQGGDLAATATFVVRVGDEPTATPTPDPTPTASPGPLCVGDCNGDERVAIDELVLGVNIAAERLPLDDCPALDAGRDGRATIDDLVGAVGNALGGCE